MSRRMLAVMLVGVAVGLNIVSAVILKQAADMNEASTLLVGVLILLVVIVNLLRVAFWAAIHKRFRLSDSYPLTSLFFPMILLVSMLYGEDIGYTRLFGAVLITLGVMLLLRGEKAGEQEPAGDI